MDRRGLVAANWKMSLSHKATVETTRAVVAQVKRVPSSDLVLCPSFTTLAAVKEALAGVEDIALGGQNVHWEEKGAWTGEVSISQLKEYATWCIVGHSERRALTGETDEQVAQKAALLLRHRLVPIVCLGETAAERDAAETVANVTAQTTAVMGAVQREHISRLVIAYEPIWAIGTGETPEPHEAAETMLLIRKIAAEHFDHDTAQRLRVLYGGSVKPDNVADFVEQPGVDGVLVGGASLRPLQLNKIVEAVARGTAQKQ